MHQGPHPHQPDQVVTIPPEPVITFTRKRLAATVKWRT